MPYKDKEYAKARHKEYSRAHYVRNMEEVRARSAETNKRTRARNRAFIVEIKESNPCTDCGNFYPYYVMHFDHIYEKNGSISDLSRSGHSIKRIQQEIDGCELVCANCHAIRTHERRIEDDSEWV